MVSEIQEESVRPIRLTRTEQQAVTRERLLKAAEEVISRHGYGGASVDLIAAEAGFSKGAVYSNFDSKEAVFLELLGHYMERDFVELEKIVSLEPKKLVAAATKWLMATHADADCPLLVSELQLHARRSPDFAKRYYVIQDKQTRTLARILTTYFKALSVAPPLDPIDLAGALTALAHGLSLQRPANQGGNEAGRVIAELLKFLTHR